MFGNANGGNANHVTKNIPIKTQTKQANNTKNSQKSPQKSQYKDYEFY